MAVDTAQHVSLSLADHLPILVVVVPFMAAPVAVLIGNRTAAQVIAFLAALTSLVVSSLLLMEVIDGGYISYHVGGWPPPIGIEYRIDAANAFVLLLISAIGVGRSSLCVHQHRPRDTEAASLPCLCLLSPVLLRPARHRCDR